jgi:AraC family transcriptional regulator of arabinose operon
MSQPSHWPLPADGIRFVTPSFLNDSLKVSPLAGDCYPSAMGYYPSARGHSMSRKQHDDNLLIFCVDGEGSLETSARNARIHAGELVILPANTPHHYRASRERPWSIYWCHFTGHRAKDYVQLITGGRETLTLAAINRVKLMRDFQSLLNVRETGYRELPFIHASAQLKQILSFIALQSRNRQSGDSAGLNLSMIDEMMRSNIEKSLTLDELAAACNLSKFHFANKYREATVYSPIKHFLHMKVEMACELLDTTDLRISAVSRAIGYDDPLYFSRLFKKITGLSPKDYRASHKK